MQPYLIRQAQATDVGAIGSLFDHAVAWLVAHGSRDQWGDQPLSAKEAFMERCRSWVSQDICLLAEDSGCVVGMLTLTVAPPAYVQHMPELRQQASQYIAAFVTEPQYRGRGVGAALLSWAEVYALQQNRSWLQVDCWAGKPALPAYYQRMGFTPVGSFVVGEWPGMLLEKLLRSPVA